MAAGADLLLKGAYTQSRIRQMIFGGATRHIIMDRGCRSSWPAERRR